MDSRAMDRADDHRPHRWQCPVIMKTHPELIAYTCSLCGAVGVVGGDEPISQLRLWALESGDRDVTALECVPHKELGEAGGLNRSAGQRTPVDRR